MDDDQGEGDDERRADDGLPSGDVDAVGDESENAGG